VKKCKVGYYYCYTDKKCKKIPVGYRRGLGGYLRKETEEEKKRSMKYKSSLENNKYNYTCPKGNTKDYPNMLIYKKQGYANSKI